MHFDFVFLRRSDIFFANQTLEGIGSRNAVDGNERAFGESRRDASDATDDDGTHAGNDRGFVSEKGMKMGGICMVKREEENSPRTFYLSCG